MNEQNGQIEQPIKKLVLEWNPERQDVGLSFDPAEFKSWEFIIAILEMAKQKAGGIQKVMQMQHMQQQAQAQAHANALKRNLQL